MSLPKPKKAQIGAVISRGCCIKNATSTLWHISKIVTPRVKAQARGQNNRSRALK